MNNSAMIDWKEMVLANLKEAQEVLGTVAVLTALGMGLAAVLKANQKP